MLPLPLEGGEMSAQYAGRARCLHDAAVLALDRQGGKTGAELDTVEASVDRLISLLCTEYVTANGADGVEARAVHVVRSRWPWSDWLRQR